MRFYRFLVLFLALSGFSLISALEHEELRATDVHHVMQQLLDLHVEVNQPTPELIKRSYAIYFDQADPLRLYLIESEVAPYLKPSVRELRQSVARYKKENFQDYEAINNLVGKGIQRAHYFRPQLQAEVSQWILEDREGAPFTKERSYAKSIDELKERQRQQLYLFAKRALKRSGKMVESPQDLESVWALYDRRIRAIEQPYLSQEQYEHYLTLHMLKALSKSLDSHTAYFSANEALSMRTQLEKGFTGIGVVLEDGLEGIMVARLTPGGPAEKTGKIFARDTIVEVDGQTVVGAPFEEVLERLRGPEGSTVDLGLMRKGEHLEVRLKREQITMDDSRVKARYEFFGDGIIGTIALDSFYEGANGISSANDLKQAIADFRKVGKIKGLVLDLRENLGGFLSQAIKVAGLFITNGVVAMSKYSDGVEVYFRELDGHTVYDGPLIVLTSKASASAAEIVAQSLQDYGVALVAGDTKTWGKGSIQHQTITNANADAYFKVTVGRYYTVSGKSTQIEGVKADIVIPSQLYDEKLGEEHLEYPLKADRMNPAFRDTLSDIDPLMRRWFVKYYLPTLQQRKTYLTNLLPLLKKNSEHRIQESQNYQKFIEVMKRDETIQFDEVAAVEELKSSYGSNDIQLEEAINIIKDIIILQVEEQPLSENSEATNLAA